MRPILRKTDDSCGFGTFGGGEHEGRMGDHGAHDDHAAQQLILAYLASLQQTDTIADETFRVLASSTGKSPGLLSARHAESDLRAQVRAYAQATEAGRWVLEALPGDPVALAGGLSAWVDLRRAPTVKHLFDYVRLGVPPGHYPLTRLLYAVVRIIARGDSRRDWYAIRYWRRFGRARAKAKGRHPLGALTAIADRWMAELILSHYYQVRYASETGRRAPALPLRVFDGEDTDVHRWDPPAS